LNEINGGGDEKPQHYSSNSNNITYTDHTLTQRAFINMQ